MIPNPLTEPHLAFIGGLRAGEIAIVLILLFLLFGAKKIPEMMRSLGRAQGEYQHARKQFEKELKATEGGEAKATAAAASPSTGTTYTPEADLDAAQAKAKELGIDPDGKSVEELNKEIAAKTGGPTA